MRLFKLCTKRKQHKRNNTRNNPHNSPHTSPHRTPAGYHDGVLTQISIRRRGYKQITNNRNNTQPYPSGWDIVDTYTDQLIAEFNDETALPVSPLHRSKFNHGHNPYMGKLYPADGSELAELFNAIYTLCYNTTIDAMQLIAQALPEHKDSADGQPIAQLTFSAYTKLPETIKLTKKQAYKQGYTKEEPF